MQRLGVASVLPVALAALMIVVLCLTAITAPMACAQEPTYSLQAVPDKAAYHIGATPQLSVTLDYKDSGNLTIMLKVAETGQVLISGLSISGTGQYVNTFALSLDQDGDGVNDYTNSTGTRTYTLKAIDEGSLITIASCQFTITVQEESVVINVAWEDADGDRLIELDEPVTLHIQVVWAFLKADKSVSLYVDDVLVTTFTLTSETGQVTYDHMVSFSSIGIKYVTIKLVDAEGNIVASKTVMLRVQEEPMAQAPGITAFISQNMLTIVLLLIIVVLLIVIAARR